MKEITLEHLETLRIKYNLGIFTIGEYWGAFRMIINSPKRSIHGEHMISFEIFLKHNLKRSK